MLDLLHGRFDPDAQAAGGLPASFMCPEVVGPPVPGESAEQAADRAHALAEAICTAPVSLADRGHLQIGGSLEEVFYVSLAPEQTWLGWLLHMMGAPRPFSLSVHVQATERYRERMAQKRRYKRLYGVNRGIEQHGRPLDPDARVAEEEAAELERRARDERRRRHLPREHLRRALRALPRPGLRGVARVLPGHRAGGHDGLRRAHPARPVRPGSAVAVDAAARARRRTA